jgi:hypothetical protein
VNPVAELKSIGACNCRHRTVLICSCACVTLCICVLHTQGIGKAIGTDADSRDGREMKMCSSFANSGPLPLLFVDR